MHTPQPPPCLAFSPCAPRASSASRCPPPHVKAGRNVRGRRGGRRPRRARRNRIEERRWRCRDFCGRRCRERPVARYEDVGGGGGSEGGRRGGGKSAAPLPVSGDFNYAISSFSLGCMPYTLLALLFAARCVRARGCDDWVQKRRGRPPKLRGPSVRKALGVAWCVRCDCAGVDSRVV